MGALMDEGHTNCVPNLDDLIRQIVAEEVKKHLEVYVQFNREDELEATLSWDDEEMDSDTAWHMHN